MSIKTTIAHIADVHLCLTQYGHFERGADFVSALLAAVDVAVSHGASAILCAGDLLDSMRPHPRIVHGYLSRVQEKLLSLNIPMLVISGNHDLTSPHWASGMEGHNSGAGIRIVDNQSVSVDGITVHGLPYMASAQVFRQQVQEAPQADILMWHGDVSEFIGYASSDCVSLADIPEGKFQVFALGHIHQHKTIVRKTDGLVAAYPGPTEYCDLQETDLVKKMFLYDFDESGKLAGVREAVIPTRKVQQFFVRTDSELDEAVTSIQDGSLIFLHYDRTVENALPRVAAACKSSNILQSRLIGTAASVSPATMKQEAQALRKEDFVADFIDPKDPLYALAMSLLDPEIDDTATIMAYCETKLGGTIVI